MATSAPTISQVTVRGELRWQVDYVKDGKRRRALRPTEDKARSFADKVKSGGPDAEWAALTVDEKWKALRLLKAEPLAKGKSVEEVCLELLASKEGSGRAARYVTSLRHYLAQFAKGRESVSLAAVTLADIEAHLDGKGLASRATVRARISTLFKFAIRREYIKVNPCERLESVIYHAPPPRVFTVEETKQALKWFEARPVGLPWFVLTTFCGLRPEEAEHTAPEAIDFKAGHVIVEAQTSKIRQRRIVHPKHIGLLKRSLEAGGRLPLTPQAKRVVVRGLRDHFGWEEWPKDITRHSAASYWLAERQDAAFVAEQLGHSVSVLKKNYKALVTKEQAAEFWKLAE